MISKTTLLEIISCRRKGLIPAAVRALLWGLTPLYAAVIYLRNKKYALKSESVTQVSVPVISIGNLTTGGTGKTPMVIWVCRYLRSVNQRVAVISRGYGSKTNDAGMAMPNDEALEMQHRLPDVPQLQDPDRIKSAMIAIEELETECIVLDDGFQHRRLHRDLDVVLIDATNPFGYGYVLPRGLLREPLKNLKRADAIIVTRCEQVEAAKISSIVSTIQSHCKEDCIVCQCQTVPTAWIQYNGQSAPVEQWSDEPVFVCCAIGNPDSFLATTRQAGVNIVGSHFFDDHHQYSRTDLEQIVEMARRSGAGRVICTHKDLVKIAVNQFAGIPIFALQADIALISGAENFQTALQRTLER